MFWESVGISPSGFRTGSGCRLAVIWVCFGCSGHTQLKKRHGFWVRIGSILGPKRTHFGSILGVLAFLTQNRPKIDPKSTQTRCPLFGAVRPQDPNDIQFRPTFAGTAWILTKNPATSRVQRGENSLNLHSFTSWGSGFSDSRLWSQVKDHKHTSTGEKWVERHAAMWQQCHPPTQLWSDLHKLRGVPQTKRVIDAINLCHATVVAEGEDQALAALSSLHRRRIRLEGGVVLCSTKNKRMGSEHQSGYFFARCLESVGKEVARRWLSKLTPVACEMFFLEFPTRSSP